MLNSDIIEKIEREYILILIALLEKGDATVEDTQQKTKAFMALQPFSSLEDMKAKIKNYIHEHKEFQKVYITLLEMEEKEATSDVLSKTTSHMKGGQ